MILKKWLVVCTKLILNRANSIDSINFLELRISLENNKCSIGLFDKNSDFKFKVFSLIRFKSCISHKVLRNTVEPG